MRNLFIVFILVIVFNFCYTLVPGDTIEAKIIRKKVQLYDVYSPSPFEITITPQDYNSKLDVFVDRGFCPEEDEYLGETHDFVALPIEDTLVVKSLYYSFYRTDISWCLSINSEVDTDVLIEIHTPIITCVLVLLLLRIVAEWMFHYPFYFFVLFLDMSLVYFLFLLIAPREAHGQTYFIAYLCVVLGIFVLLLCEDHPILIEKRIPIITFSSNFFLTFLLCYNTLRHYIHHPHQETHCYDGESLVTFLPNFISFNISFVVAWAVAVLCADRRRAALWLQTSVLTFLLVCLLAQRIYSIDVSLSFILSTPISILLVSRYENLVKEHIPALVSSLLVCFGVWTLRKSSLSFLKDNSIFRVSDNEVVLFVFASTILYLISSILPKTGVIRTLLGDLLTEGVRGNQNIANCKWW
eukprot:TRINITY_DN10548_c0_g1_i1.p1 TRINITY_DN10548_c0_g1~~TRINITY_DN10548_c0_g1_i1.p1  ORF type:complete len:411 (-),score=21.25 TRINITY_DN10548_c0_g1_i1:41-1273(-)